jgi:lipopolysaccharide export LptBFGC system permease protein LptF
MTARQRLDQRHGVEDDRSLGTIVSDLVSHSQELMRGELAFAKREMADNAKQYGGAAAMGAAAWPFVLSAVVLLGFALATGLNEWMDTWVAFLLAGVVYLAIAGGLALTAKARVKDANLAPTKAIDETKEDLSWIKAHSA